MIKGIAYGLAAWACLAVGFIPRLLEKNHPRRKPKPEQLIPAHKGEWPHWFHWFKNWGVETWGADNQWWFKFHSFVELILVIIIVLAL